MKKLLGSTLALAMFMPAGANAELLKNLKVSGNLDIQTTSARNIADFATRDNGPTNAAIKTNDNNDRLGHAFARVMLKLDWDLLDDVHSRISLTKGASNHATRVYGTGSQNLNGAGSVPDTVFVDEAFVKVDKMLFGAADLSAGRMYYGEPGDLIVYFGPHDNYGQTVTALDAFRADWSNEHMNVTGIAGKTADTVVAGLGNAATDLRGVVVSCTKNEAVHPSLYVYNSVTHATGALGSSTGKNTNLWVAGVKAKVTTGGLNASAELAKNFGEDRSTANNTNFKGWAFLAKLGYKLDMSAIGMINPWGEFGYGTGDSNFEYAGNYNFQSIATDYRPGGIYGRFDQTAAVSLGQGAGLAGNGGLGSNGLTNRTIWGLGAKVTPTMMNKLTAGVAFYRYAFTRLPPSLNPNGTFGAARRSRNIGSEVDVTASWKHSENVSLDVTLGTFRPGAYVGDARFGTTNDVRNPATMASADLHIKF